jgi:hypothetical protein
LDSLETVKQKVVDVIMEVSGPIGFVFILGGVVLIALKLMAQHNNPNKRSEVISGLPWIAGGSILLGTALTVANIIFQLGQ